jgi:hypothetical protein
MNAPTNQTQHQTPSQADRQIGGTVRDVRKQIICINWGTKYGAAYVNRLYGMVARNLTPPFTFTCFTDNDTGIRAEVRSVPLPDLSCDLPVGTKGIWNKARLWSESLGDLCGPVLFLDLDLVVTSRLDDFFEFGQDDEVVLARNPNTLLERLGQTSVYRFPVGKLAPLKVRFEADPQAIANEYRFEQRFVTRNAPGGVRFWPSNWVRHFRHDCVRSFPMNYFYAPKLPSNTKIVIFPGPLNPPEAIEGCWQEGAPVLAPVAHLRATFSKNRQEGILKHLRHYSLPCRWIADHWVE